MSKPPRTTRLLYVGLQAVHVNGAVVLVFVLEVARGNRRFLALGRRGSHSLFKLHELRHVWGDVLRFASWWRRLEVAVVLLTVHQLLDVDGFGLAD